MITVRKLAKILVHALQPVGKKYIFFQLSFLQEAGLRFRQ
jgi:hypothetical protein